MNPVLKELTSAYLAYMHEHGFAAAIVLVFPDRNHSCTISSLANVDDVAALLRAEASSLESDARYRQTIVVEIHEPNEADPNVS